MHSTIHIIIIHVDSWFIVYNTLEVIHVNVSLCVYVGHTNTWYITSRQDLTRNKSSLSNTIHLTFNLIDQKMMARPSHSRANGSLEMALALGAKAKPVTLSTSTSTNSDTLSDSRDTSSKNLVQGLCMAESTIATNAYIHGTASWSTFCTIACSIILANKLANLTGWNEKCAVIRYPARFSPYRLIRLSLTNTFKKKGHPRTPYSRRYFTMQQILAMFQRWKLGRWSKQFASSVPPSCVLITLALFIRGTFHQGQKPFFVPSHPRYSFFLSCGKREQPNYWHSAGI